VVVVVVVVVEGRCGGEPVVRNTTDGDLWSLWSWFRFSGLITFTVTS